MFVWGNVFVWSDFIVVDPPNRLPWIMTQSPTTFTEWYVNQWWKKKWKWPLHWLPEGTRIFYFSPEDRTNYHWCCPQLKISVCLFQSALVTDLLLMVCLAFPSIGNKDNLLKGTEYGLEILNLNPNSFTGCFWGFKYTYWNKLSQLSSLNLESSAS